MTSLSRILLIGLTLFSAAGSHAAPETKAAAYRPDISQAGSAVVIEQRDRLVIVQSGNRVIDQVRTLDTETTGAGRTMPVEVTIRGDADGNGGAIVRIDDRKVMCDGDAVIELIPRQTAARPTSWTQVLGSIAAPGPVASPAIRNMIRLGGLKLDRVETAIDQVRQHIDMLIEIGAILKDMLDRGDFRTLP